MAEQNGQDRIDIDLGRALGADAGVSSQCFTVYIPNKDRNGQEIGNQRKWVLEAIRLLSEMNGGASAMPPIEGGWLADEGQIIWENPVVVYSFIQGDRFCRTCLACASSCIAWGGTLTRVKSPLSLRIDSTVFEHSTPRSLAEENHDQTDSRHWTG